MTVSRTSSGRPITNPAFVLCRPICHENTQFSISIIFILGERTSIPEKRPDRTVSTAVAGPSRTTSKYRWSKGKSTLYALEANPRSPSRFASLPAASEAMRHSSVLSNIKLSKLLLAACRSPWVVILFFGWAIRKAKLKMYNTLPKEKDQPVQIDKERPDSPRPLFEQQSRF